MLDELYEIDELQPEFVEETEKPYDKYLKLHNYDPKTNTVEIDGKRVNAGARNISSKERNRMNKILRENDYDPKTSTYKSDIKVKNPKTGEMKNQRIKLNFDTRKPTQSTSARSPKGPVWDMTHINVQPKDLRRKPKESGSSLGHEEGHIVDDNDKSMTGENKSKEIRDIKDEAKRVNKEDFKDLKYSDKNEQMQHANDPGEKYADLYGELHNKHGFGGRKMQSGRFKNEDEKPLSDEKKKAYTNHLESINKERSKVKDVDKKVIDDLISNDENYDWLLGKKKDSERTVSRFKEKLAMSPEDRLENILGYSSEEIEELKKSGEFEDTLKEHKLGTDFLKSRLKKYEDDASAYAEELNDRRNELLNNEDFQNKAREKTTEETDKMNKRYDNKIAEIHDQLYAKKNYDAEMDSRSNYVERKIRELAEKDPEVKRKLAQYDEAMARRKQKLEKRKANKAEARAREQDVRRAQQYTEYYLDDIEITW